MMEFWTLLFLFLHSFHQLTLSNDLNFSSSWRLPTNVQPVHYDVKLTTKIEEFNSEDESSFVFDGQINITIQASEADVKEIHLNAWKITITTTTLTRLSDGTTILLKKINPDISQYQIIIYELESDVLEVGVDYVLEIRYTGRHEGKHGLYTNTYIEDSNRYSLISQLETTFARQVFPCFDEPALRATWSISISLSKNLEDYHVLANTEPEGEPIEDPDNNNNIMYVFKKTRVSLPSYLIAIVVSDFKPSEPSYFLSEYGSYVGPKEFRTFGEAQFIDKNMTYVSQVIGPECMEYFTQKMGIGYPLAKIDQVGVDKFSFGAMENWGLVIYRNEKLFPELNNTVGLYAAAEIIVHELAHQWFGNLVTLHWWSDTWLNEGFASYFQHFALSQLKNNSFNFHTYDIAGRFRFRVIHTSMYLDSNGTALPLTTSVETPEEIADTFNPGLAYSKGPSVINMLTHILGEDIFYKGLQIYLKERQLKEATPQHLTSAFQSAVDQAGNSAPNLGDSNVDEIVANWRLQSGFPVVTAERIEPGKILLSQNKFYSVPQNSPEGVSDIWFIPITYTTNKNKHFNTSQHHWLTSDGETLTIDIDEDVEWFIVNNQQTGYYIVNYDEDNWLALIKVLNNPVKFKDIHKYNRMQLLHDVCVLTKSTYANYLDDEFKDKLVKYLEHEDNEDVKKALPYQCSGKYQMGELTNGLERKGWKATLQCR